MTSTAVAGFHSFLSQMLEQHLLHMDHRILSSSSPALFCSICTHPQGLKKEKRERAPLPYSPMSQGHLGSLIHFLICVLTNHSKRLAWINVILCMEIGHIFVATDQIGSNTALTSQEDLCWWFSWVHWLSLTWAFTPVQSLISIRCSDVFLEFIQLLSASFSCRDGSHIIHVCRNLFFKCSPPTTGSWSLLP